MSIFTLPRVPECEVMDEAGQVQAYSAAATQIHLDKIDNTFVDHAMRLLDSRKSGSAIDIGSGPGQIVLKLAERLTHWRFVGVDRSPNMIEHARASLAAAGLELGGRVEFRVADGNRLPFPDAAFDFVMCNSVLHHFRDPNNLLREMARVAKPAGAVLLRDLRRPSRFAYPLHVRYHGRRYFGTMYKLFCDSVRAAYTVTELEGLLEASPLRDARVFAHGFTHLGVERRAASDS
jgi:ubiquinone/menaquinone biosynthesis C-methylase UbiE